MRRFLSRLTVLSVLLTLSVAGVALAHTTVSPEQVPPESFEVLTVQVPGEKGVPVVEERVEVPEGFTVLRVQPVPGWDYEFEREGGVIKAIVWSGGEISETEFQQFHFQAQTPEETGEYAWKAFDTYSDGSVSEWTGPVDSEEPASVVQVASESAEEESGSHHSGMEGMESGSDDMGSMEAGSQESAEAPLPDTGGTSPVVYIGFGAVAMILGVALMMRLRRIG